MVGVSIPLPIFDRNQGNISAARQRLYKARELARQADVSLNAELVDVYQSMVSAYEQTVNLRDRIIPASQKAFDAAREGYTQGKFGYLVLLDASERFLRQSSNIWICLSYIIRSTLTWNDWQGTQ